MTEQEIFRQALSKAMDLCARREICRSAISEKLMSWGLDGPAAERAVEMLVKERFIDEERYARAFVKDKFSCNKWGKYKLALLLRAKKIPESFITDALATIDDETYIRTIRDELKNHRRQIRAKNLYDLKGKMLRFGLSRGYESSILYELLDEAGMDDLS